MNENKIFEEIQRLQNRYEEIQVKDFSRELALADEQDEKSGNHEFRNYKNHCKNIIEKAAERNAMLRLYPVAENEKRASVKKKQLKQTEEFAQQKEEYLAADAFYQELCNADTPAKLSEQHLKEFHEQYLQKIRKEELASILWNAEYLLEEAASLLRIENKLTQHLAELALLLREKIDGYFLQLKQDFFYIYYKNGKGHGFERRAYLKVDADTFDDFAQSFLNRSGSLLEYVAWEEACGCPDVVTFAAEFLLQRDPEVSRLKEMIGPLDEYKTFERALTEEICAREDLLDRLRVIVRNYKKEQITKLLCQNEYYAWVIEKQYREEEKRQYRRVGLLDAIPETYPELFPLARKMQRHFILHVGPTNSGKSHDSIESLKQAENGVYLAPLRLLAYEKYEEFMAAGIPCSMITGEEKILTEGARIQSSTIEILDFETEYDIAVIDEGQMLANPQRGSGWTMAILGIRCPLVHICLACEAENVICEIIESCGDTYEIIRHERLVPLIYKKESNEIFPKKAQRGDAFIVFSRRDVHACAAELQDHGIKCSMIYGNLPYDVRRREVKRYEEGDTDVIVATDAIGMGLNLPIRRIVFLRAEKFDGVEQRELLPQEVKQIAGRAGRYKMFDCGIVSSDVSRKMIGEFLRLPDIPIENAVIGFPDSLISVKGNLSFLFQEWSDMKALKGYEMADLSEQIQLARELEELSDDKNLIYRFVMIPFDIENDRLHAIWREFFLAARDKMHVNIYEYMPKFDSEELSPLEEDFKVCDLLYHYAKMFLGEGQDQDILEVKNQISDKIMEILKKQAPEYRTCRYCGKKLPFHYKYNVCEKCYRRRSRRQ